MYYNTQTGCCRMSALFAWLGLSFGSALTAAAMPIMQERVQAERLSTMFWLRIVMLLVALPVLVFIGFPDNPTFYAATFVTGFIWVYADLSSMRASEEFGSTVMTRLIPLNVLVTFFMWIAIDPYVLEKYIQTPIRSLCIILSICAAVFFAMRLQKGSITREHLRAVGPVILMSGMGVVFAKIALDSVSMHSGVFGYITFQAVFMIIILGAYQAIWRPVLRAVFAGRVAITSGFLTGLVTLAHMVCKSYGYLLVGNPAYVSAVILTAPVWVMLYYRLFQKQAIGDLKAGFWVVLSVAALAASLTI
jgi:hypothetical protein